MITLDADNRYVYIRGADRATIRALERATSYLVQGFMHSMAFKLKRWDGREHLMQFRTTEPSGYRVPFGLLGDVIGVLDEMGKRHKLLFARRRRPERHVQYEWNSSIELRPYQHEAIQAITDASRWDVCRGILKMPIRSGKTKTAARVIYDMKVRTLFIVTSQMLLHQTKAALEDALKMDVGAIGDSGWTEGDVTVAMIQTLGRARGRKADRKKGTPAVPMDERYKALKANYDLIIFDECHHLRGDVWHQVFMDFDAPYKIGLSATVYFDNKRETEKGVIWLKACCGDIRVDISTTRLIREGFLMKPTILLYRCETPDLTEHGWSATLRNEAIYENEWRNNKIVALAKEQINAGLKVLIVTNRLNQVDSLMHKLDVAGLNFEQITGNDDSETRKWRVKAFVTGAVSGLVGTVFGEGVDIPEIECVINAEGGRDVKATVQRMRNLTPNKGKTEAVFIDFIDVTNGYFAEHTAERFASYRSEEAFTIKIVG